MTDIAALNKWIDETGGPIHPISRETSEGATLHMPGMTLRDYFAAQALHEYASYVQVTIPPTFKVVAEYCYQMADAMLAAREVKP